LSVFERVGSRDHAPLGLVRGCAEHCARCRLRRRAVGAARLRGSGKLDQTDITGTTTETTSGRGSASLSAARKAKKPSAACKRVR
jgi:hypothetical protein